MYRSKKRKRPRVREGLTALLPVLEAQTGGPATRSFEACKTLAEHGEEERLAAAFASTFFRLRTTATPSCDDGGKRGQCQREQRRYSRQKSFVGAGTLTRGAALLRLPGGILNALPMWVDYQVQSGGYMCISGRKSMSALHPL